jgi:dnd system-associated protein 4
MERRIATGQDQIRFLEDLVTNVPGEEFPLFETKQKALMFAAALGFHLERRNPLTSRDASTAIRFDVFEKHLDDGFVSCLAVATTNQLGVLSPNREDELALIFEEYASAGLAEIQARVWGRPEPLQALVALINDARISHQSEGLEGLDSGVLADLLRRS